MSTCCAANTKRRGLASGKAIRANDSYLGYAGALTPYTHGMLHTICC